MSLQGRIVGEIPHLRRFARSLTRNTDDADEFVQAVLERALGRLHLLLKPASLRPWLFRMMYNLHVNARLRDARITRSAESDRLFQDQSVPAAQESRLETRGVIEAMRLLPDEQRAAILLTAIEDLSYQEAAEQDALPGTPNEGQTVTSVFDITDPLKPGFIKQIPLGYLDLPSGRLRNKKSINLVYVRPGSPMHTG